MLIQIERRATSRTLNIPALCILGELIANNTGHQQAMLNLRGFSIISFMIQQSVLPCNVTSEFLFWMKDLALRLKADEILDDFFSNLILDFRLWIYTEYEVQQELLKILQAMNSSQLKRIYSTEGVQGLLDVLRYCFWEIPDLGSVRDTVTHPSTGVRSTWRITSRKTLEIDLLLVK